MSRANDTPFNSQVCLTPPRGGGTERTGASWAPQESPSAGAQASQSSPPRRSLGSNASAASIDKSENNDAQSSSAGIQDKLGQMAATTGSNALLGMLELLKFAGGATLSTTGKIVAPPLHVTRTVLLPALWAAAKDFARDNTPQRVKDWLRIVSSSLYHIQSVLIKTDHGKDLRNRVGTVGIDIVDCASSEASRQAFVDAMACLVKLSEALHTPEMKALLEQMSVLGCRMVDAASTGRTKKLLHDTSECVWAAVELFADPAATLAFAEVTAYLCHALEMENELHRPISTASMDANTRAQMRRDRNRYERQTYIDPHLIGDPDATAEQAILSSLGRGDGGSGGSSIRDIVSGGGGGDVDADSLPSNVILNERAETSAMGSESQSLKETIGEAEDGDDTARQLEQHWNEHASEVVNVELLQRQVSERAKRLSLISARDVSAASPDHAERVKDQHGDEKVSDEDETFDMEDLKQPTLDTDDNDAQQATPMQSNVQNSNGRPPKDSKRPHMTLEEEADQDGQLSNREEVDPHAFDLEHEYILPIRDSLEPIPNLADDTPATDQFYRALDELIKMRRNEKVETLLAGESKPAVTNSSKAGEKKEPSDARILHPKPTSTQEQSRSVRSVVRSLAAEGEKDVKSKLDSSERPTNRSPTPLGKAWDRYTVLLGLFLGCLAIVAVFWFIFGCYGMYVYFFSTDQSVEIHADPSARQIPGTQEIVVRIVREVVHVNSNGDVLQGATPDASTPQKLDADGIAACISEAVN